MNINIVGAAGVVGSSTTFTIAGKGLADEIVMLGTERNIVASHAMDIQAAMTGLRNITVRFGDYEDISALNFSFGFA